MREGKKEKKGRTNIDGQMFIQVEGDEESSEKN